MPTCLVFIATSVDGFIARPDGGLDWLKRVERDGEDYGFQKFFDSIDTIVIGRGTYDVTRAFETWPYLGKRCVVMTHRPTTPRVNEEFFAGTPAELLSTLEGRVYVDGGNVISQFLATGLIEQMTISQIPIVLGEGLPLFKAPGEHPLTLVESRAFPSGLVQTTWRLTART
ncbi:MAG: dihydrofolate reductase family protein [Archangium sp.]|nr:dihydrofolate reductase family protein [Archangium sp.]MDP3158043.1 dihydrofolate reductase family protein [Archangium sp.]MDP3570551.1 dihydrofolate reductase family protein [Archangium sp.]